MSRLAYLGTPEPAVPPLRALVEAGHEVVLVVSRADARRGRGSGLSPSPVKQAALELGLPVTDRLADVADAGAELGVVVAYGRIIPVPVLERLPMVNLHFSALPRWRGAAPVERAILAGDVTTAVCVMAVEEGLDTGPVYAAEAVDVDDHDLASLRRRLVAAGSRLLVALLADGVAGLPEPVPQQGDPTYAEKVRPEEYLLHWDRPAVELARVVRLGRALATVGGTRLRVLRATAEPGQNADPPGSLRGELVATGEGALRLLEVQPEGRRPMRATDWRRGARLPDGARLDP